MDLKYVPPAQDEVECAFLRRNFLNCLRQKSRKDQDGVFSCNPEHLLWFNLDCPKQYKQFNDPRYLRKTFIEEKNIQNGPTKPQWVRL